MAMKRIQLLFILFLCHASSWAEQDIWTLKQCIDHALTHNIQIRQQSLQVKNQEISLNSQKMRRLPNLDAYANESFGFGRALTSNNTYANRNTQNTGFGLSTGIPVFTGFEIKNSTEKARLNLEAALKDLEKAKESLALEIASYYLNVLYNKELAEVARLETESQRLLLKQTEEFWKNGKKAESEVFEARSLLAQAELSEVKAAGTYQLAVLDLTQILELDSPENFTIAPVEGDTMAVTLEQPELIFLQAQSIKPEIEAEKIRLQSADKQIKIARSGYYPQISLSAGIGISYYKTSGYNSASFNQQIKDNFTQNIGLSFNMPLFDRMQTRNAIRTAKVQYSLQQLQLEDVQKKLYKEIQQAYYNAETARSQFRSCQSALVAAESAYQLMQGKYLNGKATSTELQNQRTQWLKASSEQIRAKYEWILRKKILDFYAGRKIE